MRETGHPEVVIRQWFDHDDATRKQRDERITTSQKDVQHRGKPEEDDTEVTLAMHPQRNSSLTISHRRNTVAIGEVSAGGAMTAAGDDPVLAEDADIRACHVTTAILTRWH
jgi:hypothetical protein